MPTSAPRLAAPIDWDALDAGKYEDEAAAVARLLETEPLGADAMAVRGTAIQLVEEARRLARRQGVVESFLQEFGLSTPEGLALMCLAEALLRTPDEATRDALIAEKIGSADWASHVGRSDSVFVNAGTWGLMLTGRLVEPDDAVRRDLGGFLKGLAGRIGEPMIRRAVATAIGVMGDQFVLGRTIQAALKRAARGGFVCSFDMLGEGARTFADAERYEASYLNAIAAVGEAAGGTGPEDGHGISVKLSALHPRYEATQEARMFDELYPRLLRIVVAACEQDINLTLDAEEADRLALSLKLLEKLAEDPALGEWRGLGLAVQAYQKRGPEVIDQVAELARRSARRLMVRLVKGAYWDAEIKRAQIGGRPDYPVFTTKAATDLSYLVSADRLLAAAPALYGQFATHNAHTLASVRRLSERRGVRCERQRLHGMGEALHGAASARWPDMPLRVYAPVGGHEDLLPYLVRRLLENGANTSFVHALLDDDVPPTVVVSDPIAEVRACPGPHPKIPKPRDFTTPERRIAAGVDLSVAAERARLTAAVASLDGLGLPPAPADAKSVDIDRAFASARAAQGAWDAAGGVARQQLLAKVADAIEARLPQLVALLTREAGKTLADGVAEVREAADFCRYYGAIAAREFAGPRPLPGPVGEANVLELHGRGVFVAISPWNFPLSIFTGQIAAALAAGNAVVAKPAEQTPRIAAGAVHLFHAAGLDPRLLTLTPGDGESVGQALSSHPGCDGVAFTGGTDTAWAINRKLAARDGPIVPFIAETGGLNAMFVDTTALREQVIDDAILSAFGSAGQRCSALRLLIVPDEVTDSLITGLAGAMDALVLGDPADPATDIGPVIDAAAKRALEAHAAKLVQAARVMRRLQAPDDRFFPPMLAEIPHAKFLTREVFGPILHVLRYPPGGLTDVAKTLAATRYGLTLGIHSRLESFADEVRRLVPAGNAYVNRSIIGAVVGVQPFGGEGLSGTGPKAGGPYSLTRFAVERTVSVNTAAQGGDPALFNL
ncbi:MAG TPA: L-glutamate gamma-semialdehyde dehydrogenase [Caulobacteraceae bacterium]|jgi:RHH-type proline utilization regulon transcriptional repressor/proline dehydrogenase/delta 1-pyrroline-5-carboxylate dehydrogenase